MMYFVMPATGCNQVASPSYTTGDYGTWVFYFELAGTVSRELLPAFLGAGAKRFDFIVGRNTGLFVKMFFV